MYYPMGGSFPSFPGFCQVLAASIWRRTRVRACVLARRVMWKRMNGIPKKNEK